jgi:uncharacterized protein (TIGR01777 family)
VKKILKILIFGGSGNIGKFLAKKLIDINFEVINISRNINKSKNSLPFVSNHLELNDSQTLLQNFKDSDAIVNLAGFPISEKWTAENKKLMYDSRIDTTNYIVDLINQSNKSLTFVSTSAIGFYGSRQDEFLQENSSSGNDFMSKICVDWEKSAKKVNENIRLVIPRIGIVLEKNSGALPKMLLPFKLFAGGKLGSGHQWMSWIHIEDLVNLFVEIIINDKYNGIVNAVSPNPITNSDFTKAISKVMKRPAIAPVPEFALKLILGESSALVLNSQKVLPQVANSHKFIYKFEEVENALLDLI